MLFIDGRRTTIPSGSGASEAIATSAPAEKADEAAADKRADGGAGDDVPFEIDGYLTEIDTGRIDSDYMNSRFEKFLKIDFFRL